MRSLSLWAVLAALAMTSCGIETVSTLAAPDVYYLNQAAGETKLTLTHSASRYTDTYFQGYEVYYRIYPLGTFPVQIAADISTLSSGPLSTLTSMGYKSFAMSTGVDTAQVTDSLKAANLQDGDVITLDFTDFLASGNTGNSPPNQPLLTVTRSGAVVSTAYAYRTTSLAGITANLQKFSTLWSDSTVRADMLSVADVGNQYEVEVFIVAYGMTPNIESLLSKPVAWGVFYPITRNS